MTSFPPLNLVSFVPRLSIKKIGNRKVKQKLLLWLIQFCTTCKKLNLRPFHYVWHRRLGSRIFFCVMRIMVQLYRDIISIDKSSLRLVLARLGLAHAHKSKSTISETNPIVSYIIKVSNIPSFCWYFVWNLKLYS